MNFKEIEEKWQKWWEEHPELSRAEIDSKKEKKYVLAEFPYPSGSGLHMGHAFSYTGADIYARYQRMKGFNVLFPMGWDAFGLPTENYAIKTKQKPQVVTKNNTDNYRKEMKHLAFSFDWSREVNTTDPNYYKWTQWIFVQLFKKGLAYKQEMPINWCPKDKIGLANEEVVDGKCERCGTEVERRTISQWVVKITDYADRLIDGLKNTDFIEKVKASQINWIGRKDGINISFDVKGTDQKLTVFTTTPVNFGATFLVVAPEHQFVSDIVAGKFGVSGEIIKEIKNYIVNARKKSEMERTELGKEKTGVFSGLYAINHVNGKEIPIWITDFVLATYGTGAVQGCPGHDQRDWDFAKKFGIPIPQVVDIPGKHVDVEKECFQIHAGDKGVMVNSDFLNGMDFTEAMQKTMDYFEEKGWGKRVVTYHLRDWIFSRQHYWGEPIPMINCPKDGWVPVPEEELPVNLPEVEAYEPTDDGKSPLSKIESFVNCKCPVCGGDAKRETDTMPNWAGSDWYFLRYCDPVNKDRIAEIETLKKWMPVDVYVGGDEHNTLHLLYSRFIYQFLWDLGAVPKEIPEPYFHRMSHGVILGPDNSRMSKSKGNVVVPELVADKYGVDVLRMYLMFMGPFEGTMAWNEKTLMGVKRFLDRFEKFVESHLNDDSASRIDNKLLINRLIKGVEKDIENFGFNTAIAKQMKAINELVGVNKEELSVLVRLLAPFAPYMAEEMWSRLGNTASVHKAGWPVFEEKYLTAGEISVAVAVNGKVRDQMVIGNGLKPFRTKEEIINEAKKLEKIKGWIEGKTIVKEIYVPGKMINLVVK